MIEIENTIISRDVVTVCFSCDLNVCRGACCVHGDSGAPLEAFEVTKLQRIFPLLKPHLRHEGILAIEEQGTAVQDVEKDMVTPLVEGKECAYAVFEKGMARCGIEMAFEKGVVDFRKPVSCQLYPIRIRKYRDFEAVNYDRWEICEPALLKGTRLSIPLFRFLERELISRFGREWYESLKAAAENMNIK